MFPEDPNAPIRIPQHEVPAGAIVYTQEEINARKAACVCGKLPFYLGENVACSLHDTSIFNRLILLRRAIPSGDTGPDEESQLPHPEKPLT